MQIISIVNQKGGVAKTTSTVNIAKGLIQEGKKVLLVDLDPQANATSHLNIDKIRLKHTIYDLMKKYNFSEFKNLNIDDVIIQTDSGIDLIPTNIKMSKADFEITALPAKETKLRKVLKEVKNYDYVLIDCQPSLGILVFNALTASDKVLIPVQGEPASIEGIAELLDTIEIVKEDLNDQLEIGGVFLTIVDLRTNQYEKVRNILSDYFNDKLFTSVIRRNVKLSEAYGNAQTIFEYAATSNGAKDYSDLVKELLRKVK
ncbi:MAG: chromosome partitioning protein ParA [Fusobacteriia bacterium 4572_132]|nr:MAG: chromosome partitioning protein ParA [Fusobacteriia bacterium 4572_132]